MPNFTLIKNQVALFPTNFFIDNLNSFYKKLLEEFKQFDGNNQLIPIPSNAPREIPRVILRTKNDSIVCQISFDKIDIHWNNAQQDEAFSVDVVAIKSLVDLVFQVVLESKKIKRIGFIKQFFFKVDNSVNEIKSKLVTENLVKDLTSYDLKLTYAAELGGHQCNNQITLQDAELVQENNKQIIIVTTDFNTYQDLDLNFTKEEVVDFIDKAFPAVEEKVIYQKVFNVEE